ncbi:prolactin regulatory element-binding protein [Bradysia coprophila]|uniref:prolactin regulatory element-binding protein n=1 Tax=Bradysia coprophila TaxID=38358 RepID=UPI00187D6EA5|nr:prolactin regulatory element-binding protein [Bradysia coprophila]
MAPTKRPNDFLLARVNFPLYTVEMLTNRHCLVAGGGGSSKTGVANGFEIYEIYHNGRHFVAEEVIRHETGANVVMNCAVTSDERRSYVVAGQESHCQMYLVNLKVVDEDEMAKSKPTTEDILRRRKSSAKPSGVEPIRSKSADVNANTKHIKFEIQPGDSVQTDFTAVDPLQRVVRISPNGKLMATGGTDGVVRVWKFPRMTKLMEFKKHTKEVDDLDFSPDSKKLVSIAKDGLGVLWDIENEKEWKRLTWDPPEGTKYLFKRCRFGIYEGKVGKSRLFTIANPFGKVGKQRGYLQAWDPDTGSLTNSVGVDESLASLAVRDDGRFVAIGSMFSGSVSMYIAFSLQKVLHIPNAHSMFVTGLQFIPMHGDGPPISSSSEAAVVSISVDNKVCIHSLQYRHTIPAWVAIVLIIVTVFLSFVFCSWIGI